MEYTNTGTNLSNKHIWQNEQVSIYAREYGTNGHYEVEIAIGYKDKDGYYFRLGNSLDEREAIDKVVNALELFE